MQQVIKDSGLTTAHDCRLECLACGHRVRSRKVPPVCRCGCVASFFRPSVQASHPTGLEPLDGAPIRSRGRRVEPGLTRLLGPLPPDARIMVYGPPGSGKSRLSLRWASLHGPSAVLSYEMGRVELLRTLGTCGARRDRLQLSPDLTTAASAVRSGFVGGVVLDSLQRMPRQERADLPAAVLRGVWWLIGHVNRRGSAKGTTDDEHDASAVLLVEPESPGVARVTVQKTRLGGASGLSELFDLAPGAPQKTAAPEPARGRQR